MGHSRHARSRLELALRILDILMRGRLRDAKLRANHPVGTAAGDQRQALDFPLRQTGGGDRKAVLSGAIALTRS